MTDSTPTSSAAAGPHGRAALSGDLAAGLLPGPAAGNAGLLPGRAGGDAGPLPGPAGGGAAPAGDRVQSVERALRILLAFGSHGGDLTVGDLARMLDVHKSTSSRLVATLVGYGFLQRGDEDRDESLRLGPEVSRLGRLAMGERDLPDLARPTMDELSARTGETTTLSVPAGRDAVTIAQSGGSYVVGPHSWLGRRSPLHSTSDGKVLLAFEAAPMPQGPLERLTPATVTDRRALRAELARVRRQGFATATGDFETGLNGVAAAIVDSTGRCHAAICVSGPNYRLKPTELAHLGALCREASARISVLLDWRSGLPSGEPLPVLAGDPIHPAAGPPDERAGG